MFSVKEIDADQLQQRMADEDDLMLIDVRSPMEIAQASIDGAAHLPLNLLPLRQQEVPKDKTVIFYCRSGARSAQACSFMMQNGYDNVINLRGGIIAWARQGLPMIQKNVV